MAIFLGSVMPLNAIAKKKCVRSHAECDIRIGTFNLWRSDLGKDDYSWDKRKYRLVQAVEDCAFDIFGAQELDMPLQQEFRDMLNERGMDYEWLVFSPYSQDGKGNKAQAIIYRKSRFEVVDYHYYWIAPNPKKMGYGWDEKPKFRRGACCATLKDKISGREIFVMHSHMPLAREARWAGADIVIRMEKKFNRRHLPSFFIGDLNARPNDRSSEIFRTYYSDSFDVVPMSNHAGSRGTFNSHNVKKDMEKAARIDYVYFRGKGITPVDYTVSNAKYDGLYPSDHCPVYVNFKIK